MWSTMQAKHSIRKIRYSYFFQTIWTPLLHAAAMGAQVNLQNLSKNVSLFNIKKKVVGSFSVDNGHVTIIDASKIEGIGFSKRNAWSFIRFWNFQGFAYMEHNQANGKFHGNAFKPWQDWYVMNMECITIPCQILVHICLYTTSISSNCNPFGDSDNRRTLCLGA